jgi:type II secretory pathway component PulF
MSRLPPQVADPVAQSIADIAAAGLPLAAGLRAAADETESRRTAGALRRIAAELDRGRPLEQVLDAPPLALPGHVRGLLLVTLRTGDFGASLVELVDHHSRLQELRRSVWAALLYPAVLVGLALAIIIMVLLLVAAPLIDMYTSFGMRLPYVTQILAWCERTGIWWLLGVVLGGAVAMPLARWGLGPARWARVRATVPLVGGLWHWSGVAELTRLVGILAAHGTPLPEALRLAADGVHDASMGQISRRLADGVGQGRALSELVDVDGGLPPLMAPLVRWGERTDRLAEALATISDLYAGRVELRARLLRAILPPLTIILVGIVIVAVLAGLILPLISMIQGLS